MEEIMQHLITSNYFSIKREQIDGVSGAIRYFQGKNTVMTRVVGPYHKSNVDPELSIRVNVQSKGNLNPVSLLAVNQTIRRESHDCPSEHYLRRKISAKSSPNIHLDIGP